MGGCFCDYAAEAAATTSRCPPSRTPTARASFASPPAPRAAAADASYLSPRGRGAGGEGPPRSRPTAHRHTEPHPAAPPMPIRLRRAIPALLASLVIPAPARAQALTPVERRIAAYAQAHAEEAI